MDVYRQSLSVHEYEEKETLQKTWRQWTTIIYPDVRSLSQSQRLLKQNQTHSNKGVSISTQSCYRENTGSTLSPSNKSKHYCFKTLWTFFWEYCIVNLNCYKACKFLQNDLKTKVIKTSIWFLRCDGLVDLSIDQKILMKTLHHQLELLLTIVFQKDSSAKVIKKNHPISIMLWSWSHY